MYPRQDARFGRDAKAAAGALPKVGGGAAGFDYSKISNDGSELALDAVLGTGAKDWACTRDNITGLIWEVKTASETDLRYSGHIYTWYSEDSTTNGGGTGDRGINTCKSTLSEGMCNTAAYVAAVNAAKLCGYADWRMPSRRELVSLLNSGTNLPSIDVTYFPNTLAAGPFWSASTIAGGGGGAWMVHFAYGYTDSNRKDYFGLMRAVRGGQF